MSSGPSYHSSTHRPETLGGSDPLQPYGFYEIKLVADDETLGAGDGAFYFAIPADLDGTSLVYAQAFVSDTGGDVVIQIHNVNTATDMLSTRITIDSGDFVSDPDSSVPSVISAPPASTVSTGDLVRIDVDSAGGGVKGGGVMLAFAIV